MTLLAAFLLARIAEDEEQGRLRMLRAQQNYLTLQEPNLLGTVIPGWGEWPAIEALAARALADCEMKRWLVETFMVTDYDRHNDPEILRRLASVYADHPDYRPEWLL